MKKNKRMLVLLAWLLPVLPLPAGDSDSAAKSEECLDCHDEVQDVLKMTIHSQRMQVNCVDCHGYSLEHIDDPEITNINRGLGAAGMERCLDCHQADLHSRRPGSDVHSKAQVYCSDCHDAHTRPDLPHPLLKSSQTDLCISCHSDVATQMAKPYTHKLQHNSMDCSSCHNPHGGRGSDRFSKHDMQATCTQCHSGIRGPFVFTHVHGMAGDCMSCHEPHGSSNPRQLTRANPAQLCLECHSTLPAGNLGSQPPSSHDLRSPRFRNCLTCHTAVHGSSRSPALLK